LVSGFGLHSVQRIYLDSPVVILLTTLVHNCKFGDETGLLSVRDNSRSARRKEIILEMLRCDPVIFDTNSIRLVGILSLLGFFYITCTELD